MTPPEINILAARLSNRVAIRSAYEDRQLAMERQAAGLLLLATKKAKIRLGRAWNTLPHLREPETAKIMLEIIAAKEVTDSTGAIAVRAAQMFAEQSEEK